MVNPEDSLTSPTLLARIREDDRDSEAWIAFVERYGRRIYEWCLLRNLQAADAEDITQEILLKLARHLGSFDYDPSLTFRGWLRRMTENAIIDYLRQRQNAKRLGGASVDVTFLSQTAAREDLAGRLESAFDLELVDLAKLNVRQRVEPHRWRAWELTAVEQWNGQDVANQLGMKIATVYSSRYQVQKLISEEVQRLEGESTRHWQQRQFEDTPTA